MDIRELHGWQPTAAAEAIELQKKLVSRVSGRGKVVSPRYIAGVDMAFMRGDSEGAAAVVVLSYPELEVIEAKIARGKPDFPYIPGLLSFRELPLTLAACKQLTITPDLVFVDGQGIAHPRRFGFASHLGIFLDVPTIGCAKSRLCGESEAPELEAGSYAELKDDDEIIGAVLRTRTGVSPLYISTGHKIDLPEAIRWTLACCRGYRMPEPTRLAHQEANTHRRELLASKAERLEVSEGEPKETISAGT